MELMVEVDRLHPNPRNKNVHTDEDINRLSATIGAYGLINPISVRPLGGEQFQIISGEGRLEAVKKLGWQKVPVRLFEEFNDLTVDAMRLAENKARTFDFLAECQEFANLHKQGVSTNSLIRDFSDSQAGLKVSIGHFPEELIQKIKSSPDKWSRRTVIDILPLRLIDNAGIRKLISKGDVRIDSATPYYERILYNEVDVAVDKINRSKIKPGSELQAYVAERRLQIEEEQREQILQAELEARITEIEEKQKRKLEELKSEIAGEFSEKVEKALAEACQAREDKAKIAAEIPQKLKALRESLKKTYTKELEQKDKTYSERLTKLQEQLSELSQERDNALSEIKDVDKEREKQIRAEFQTKLDETQQVLDALLAERERFQVEAESLRKEAESYSAEIAKLERKQREIITEKDKVITAKDEEVKRLIAKVKKASEEIDKEEVQRRVAEYQTQLNTGYEQRKKALEQYYAQREERLRIKTEKTVDDAINHFMKVCGEMDASIRQLVYSLLNHMREDQLQDVFVRAEWLHRKLLEVGDVLKDEMDERKEDRPPETVEIALPK